MTHSGEQEALVIDLRRLADSWEQHSTEASKFIDGEHADELRAILDRHACRNPPGSP